MFEIPGVVPDAQVLLGMQPEELAGKILFILRRRTARSGGGPQSLILANLRDELWPRNYLPNYQAPYPPELQAEINLAIAEAWGWMIAQSLLVPTGSHGASDSYVLGASRAEVSG